MIPRHSTASVAVEWRDGATLARAVNEPALLVPLTCYERPAGHHPCVVARKPGRTASDRRRSVQGYAQFAGKSGGMRAVSTGPPGWTQFTLM